MYHKEILIIPNSLCPTMSSPLKLRIYCNNAKHHRYFNMMMIFPSHNFVAIYLNINTCNIHTSLNWFFFYSFYFLIQESFTFEGIECEFLNNFFSTWSKHCATCWPALSDETHGIANYGHINALLAYDLRRSIYINRITLLRLQLSLIS